MQEIPSRTHAVYMYIDETKLSVLAEIRSEKSSISVCKYVQSSHVILHFNFDNQK